MALQETGKQRAARIPLDYFKHSDAMSRWKFYLSVTALALAVLYLGSGFLLGQRSESRYSHGPVHAVHQAWESQCEVCHVPFSPIKHDNWLVAWSSPNQARARTLGANRATPGRPIMRANEPTTLLAVPAVIGIIVDAMCPW